MKNQHLKCRLHKALVTVKAAVLRGIAILYLK